MKYPLCILSLLSVSALGQEIGVVAPLPFSETPGFCASPDGEYFGAVGTDSNVRIWHIGSGTFLRETGTTLGFTKGCTFTPDNRYAVGVNQGGMVYVWRADTGEQVSTFGGSFNEAFGSGAEVFISPDAAIAVTADPSIRGVWDLKNKKKIEALGNNKSDTMLGFLENGATLIIKRDGNVVAVDLAGKGRPSRSVPCPGATSFHALADTEALITCGGRQIYRWRPWSANPLQTFHQTTKEPNGAVHFTPAADAIAYLTSDTEVLVEELQPRGVMLAKLPSKAALYGIRADRKLVLHRDLPGVDRVELFDPASAASLTSFITQGALDFGAQFAKTPDGRFMAMLGVMGDIAVWDLTSGVRSYMEHWGSETVYEGEADSIAFSPSGATMTFLRGGAFAVHSVGDWRQLLIPPPPFEFERATISYRSEDVLELNAVSGDTIQERLANKPKTERRYHLKISDRQWIPLDPLPSADAEASYMRLRKERLNATQLPFNPSFPSASATTAPTKQEPVEPAVGEFRLREERDGWVVWCPGQPGVAQRLPETIGASLAEVHNSAQDLAAFYRPNGLAVLYRLSRRSQRAEARLEWSGEWTDVSYAMVTDQSLLAGSQSGRLTIVSIAAPNKAPVEMQLGSTAIRQMALSVAGDLLFVPQAQGMSIIEIARSKLLATAYSFRDTGWAVVTPDGLFDTDRFADLPITLVHPRQPMIGVSLSSAVRDRFTPRLFYRLLLGERPVFSGNKTTFPVPPDVFVRPVTVEKDGLATVEVTVKPGGSSGGQGGNAVTQLALLRDGRLIRTRSAEPGRGIEGTVRFSGVNLGTQASGVFSAYAFDARGFKSLEARRTFEQTKPAKRKATVHLLSIGVGQVKSAPRLNLAFAPNDARRISQQLERFLQIQDEYLVRKEVLISDEREPAGARKELVRSAINRLAGVARPEDQVIVSFSGHGMLDATGDYAFVPSDYVQGQPGSSLRASELRDWLGTVDAGQIALILDTCHSGGAVQSPRFRAGPLGDSSLGQLAYDKRMIVLAASQPDGLTFESEGLRMGLLSYVLTELGVGQGLADWNPRDNLMDLRELLGFVAAHAPLVDSKTGRMQRQAPRVGYFGAEDPAKPAAPVKPVLFDFATGAGIVLARY